MKFFPWPTGKKSLLLTYLIAYYHAIGAKKFPKA
jgi:hypothetical protein